MSELTRSITRQWLDVAYGTQSTSQKLDIYLPENGEGPFPVIMHIHGGAFMFGDKADDQLRPMLTGLARGYAVISINYRLSGEALFPAQIYDVKAAIRWIKMNAASYQLDASRIALWGGSAGGHLSALAGTSAHDEELDDPHRERMTVTSEVQAVVDWFGPTNFLTMDELFVHSAVRPHQVHHAADSPESRLLGSPIAEVPELVQAANPETYISERTPPFLIQHGTHDPLIPTMQSVVFAEKLRAVIGSDKVSLELLEGAGHGGEAFETTANVNRVLNFIDQYLRTE
ncbi:alpha/beta hydrolase [Paenibacillus sp. CCS19]|uniref:alpha/beta hydrolase n=1 Tax=Paenibacillus sp. CCS19 TaxID=3158387 RepID=UPI00295E604D|nr:alpha/beta hydrolase [Paenibacillus cellulosilyticus]